MYLLTFYFHTESFISIYPIFAYIMLKLYIKTFIYTYTFEA